MAHRICASKTQDRRPVSGPLTPVTRGLSRSLADRPPRRSGRVEAWTAKIPKLTVPILLTRRPLWRDQLWLASGLGFDVVLCGEVEDSGRGGDLRFGRLQDRILAGRLHGAEGLPWSSPGTISRGCSSISARNRSRCTAGSRIKAAALVSLPSAAGCRGSHPVSLAGAGSAERRGSIFRPGWRRRSSASAAMARRLDRSVACSHFCRAAMSWARVCSRCW